MAGVELSPPERAPSAENLYTLPQKPKGKPLKILDLVDAKDKKNRVKEEFSEMQVNHDALQEIAENLKKSGARYVSIVSVMGAYRTGKSFLLDLMLRYLTKAEVEGHIADAKKREEEEARRSAGEDSDDDPQASPRSPTWTMVEPGATASGQRQSRAPSDAAAATTGEDTWILGAAEDSSSGMGPPKLPDWVQQFNAENVTQKEGFTWKGGMDRCTQGMWIWSAPFVFSREGGKVAVLLMDTQGAWDATMTQAQSSSIFGLTALLSSKLVFNINKQLEEDRIQNMDYFTTFAQTVLNDASTAPTSSTSSSTSLTEKGTPFGHLEFLIRDWANYEDGFTLQQCKQQMQEHLNTHVGEDVPEDQIERVERMKHIFRDIGITALVHPGNAVTRPKYEGQIDKIDRDFFFLLDDFLKRFFRPESLLPSSPLGCPIPVDRFKQVVTNFAETFASNGKEMAVNLRGAFVKVRIHESHENLLTHFRTKVKILAPESRVFDPEELTSSLGKVFRQLKTDFEDTLKPFGMKSSEFESEVNTFVSKLQLEMNRRISDNDKEVSGALPKTMAAPVVAMGAYWATAHMSFCFILFAGGEFAHAYKFVKRENCDWFDTRVVNGIIDDSQKWFLQRYKDGQAILVCAKRFNPQDAQVQMNQQLRQLGTIAAAAANSVPQTSSTGSASNTGAREVRFQGN